MCYALNYDPNGNLIVDCFKWPQIQHHAWKCQWGQCNHYMLGRKDAIGGDDRYAYSMLCHIQEQLTVCLQTRCERKFTLVELGKQYKIFDLKVGNQQYKGDSIVALTTTTTTTFEVCIWLVDISSANQLVCACAEFPTLQYVLREKWRQ